MQILNRNRFAEFLQTQEAIDLVADLLETLPRPLSLKGAPPLTPQQRLQSLLENRGIAVNIPLPEDKTDRAPTGDELEPE